jgi:hypothetical protein
MEMNGGAVMASRANPLELECVYISESTHDFVQTHVSLKPGDDKTDIIIYPGQMITAGELAGFLKYLEGDILKKLDLQVKADCLVYITYDGINYFADLTDEIPIIKVNNPQS